ALLTRVKLSFTKNVGWRLQTQRQSQLLADLKEQRGFFLFFSQGYLEFWTGEVLKRALRDARNEVES
ncbi:MAG: hypothetical protein ACRD2O_17760, partial [Terriglobia bacterium]